MMYTSGDTRTLKTQIDSFFEVNVKSRISLGDLMYYEGIKNKVI